MFDPARITIVDSMYLKLCHAAMTSINHSDRFLRATASANGELNVRFWPIATVRGDAANVRIAPNSDQNSEHSDSRGGRSLFIDFWSLTGVKRPFWRAIATWENGRD
jgi:hypothetical protein